MDICLQFKHFLLVLRPFAFTAAVWFIISGCEEKVKPTVTNTGFGRDIPSQESWNATITFTDSGRLNAILKAGHIAAFAERRHTLLDSGITVDFYDENARHTSILTAQRGRVNDFTHDFEAFGNVVVRSDSGTTLRTTELRWINATQRVRTEAHVDISSPTEQIQGEGLESDQSLKHYTIFKVTGQAKSDE